MMKNMYKLFVVTTVLMMFSINGMERCDATGAHAVVRIADSEGMVTRI